ncbi:MAG TPA: 2OG-Fe(II) oxygenase family protein [Allosphingosinicella sp.]|nr:2OG-Fe(II) oxygenase family protein [Allosphingosinicella sp.]
MLPLRAESRPDPFRINPDLDVDELARAYAAEGRVRIYGLLAEGAVELHDHLAGRQDWIHLISTGEGVLELDPAARARLGAAEWEAITRGAHERARAGFQYRYQALRVPDEEEIAEGDDLVCAFARLMQGAPMLDLLRAVTGAGGLTFTDGQATAYGSGDFLTGHDDDVAGKDRLAAYVFGLTQNWRLEWGGLLLFHGPHDRTATALAPRFNSLDLFRVPQQHSVSEVTFAAPHRRFSVTGWLRSRAN